MPPEVRMVRVLDIPSGMIPDTPLSASLSAVLTIEYAEASGITDQKFGLIHDDADAAWGQLTADEQDLIHRISGALRDARERMKITSESP